MSPPFPSPPMPAATPSSPSGPATPVNTAQLGTIITSVLANHDALREENDHLRADLADAVRRADRAENLLSLSASAPNAALADLQTRLDTEQAAHADTRAALRAAYDAWAEYDKYVAMLDVRAFDARKALAAVLRDPQQRLDLPNKRPPSPFQPTPRRSVPTRALQPYPTMPASLPPPPTTLPPRRHRNDSVDDRPSKRQRPSTPSHPASASSEQARPPPYYNAPTAERSSYLHPSYTVYPTRTNASAQSSSPHHRPRGRTPSRADASRSRSRSRSRSLSVDHMLLDAAGDSPPQSTQPHAAQPPHIHAYQTHVFAPPVTGPPGKKRPVEKTGTVIEPYVAPSGARHASSAVAVAAGLPAGGFPATNEKGQRICRQCGLPGRYKDGKCVEKWGPGPEGPGTVCDRCRKKMKRVERRGTLDPHVLHSHGVSPPSPSGASAAPVAAGTAPAPLTSAQTLPARLVHPPIATLSDRAAPAALVPASERSHSRSQSGRSRTPSEAGQPPVPVNGGAPDHEDEADIDDDLLEAVDAAEAQSSGSGHHPLTNGNGNGWVKREVEALEA